MKMGTALSNVTASARQWLGRHTVVVEVLLILLTAFTLLRLGLLICFVDLKRLTVGELAWIMFAGFRLDALAALCWVLPQVVYLSIAKPQAVVSGHGRVCLEAGWLVGFVALPLLLIAEVLFFHEFQCRLNYVAFEYLVYPTEVCCNIWQSYPTAQLLVLIAAVGGTLYVGFRARFATQLRVCTPWRRRLGLLALTLALIGALSSTSGLSSIAITQNRTANECAGNGLYSFAYHAWTCRVDFEDWYPTLTPERANSDLRAQLAMPGTEFHKGAANPIDRTVLADRPRDDTNVVIILEESFGAEFVGALGDQRGLTPQFDALCSRGVLFDNFYATGNRTARALEAVLTSLPPIPTESILKRDHSNHVFTLANALAGRGYERLFMTGGRGVFDGVRSFMTTNGFNHFIEQRDYRDPVFTNAWGVSDEDLFNRAVEELDALDSRQKPFLAVLLTVSNHRPYTFPTGRVDGASQSRESAVRYADWALGEFFRNAQQHGFYRNTLFVVMGDHGARVYGSQLFPLNSYRIPVLMIHAGRPPATERCHTLGCSLDIAPTVMGQLGGSYRSVFFGRDVQSIPPGKGRALMQHNHDVALMRANNQMVVLGTGRTSTGFVVDPTTTTLTRQPWPHQQDLVDVIAYFQVANRVYYDECCYPVGIEGRDASTQDRQPIQ